MRAVEQQANVALPVGAPRACRHISHEAIGDATDKGGTPVSNAGHTYGSALGEAERADLLEYLRTL